MGRVGQSISGYLVGELNTSLKGDMNERDNLVNGNK